MGFVFGFVKMKRWVGLSSALSLELTLIIYDIGGDSANSGEGDSKSCMSIRPLSVHVVGLECYRKHYNNIDSECL